MAGQRKAAGVRDFEQFAEELPHIAWTLGPGGDIRYVNRRWRDYTQLTAEETAARDAWSRITPAEDIERVSPLWRQSVAIGAPFVVEHRLKAASADASAYRWHLVNVVPIPGGWIGTATDIHDRKAVEEALRESEEFLRRVIDSSDDCIKLLDLDGRLRFLSPNGAVQLGIADPAAVLGSDWIEFWAEDDRDAARAAIATARAGGTGRFEAYFPKVDTGEPRWWNVAVSPVYGPTGAPERLLASSRDITRRRRDEQRQRFLLQGGATLSSSLDLTTTLDNVARIAVETIARFCFVDMLDAAGRLERVAFAHADRSTAFDIARSRDYVPVLRPSHPIARAIASEAPVLERDIDDHWIATTSSSEVHAEQMRSMGVRSVISAPLRSSHGTFGALTLCLTDADARSFDTDDLAFAAELARQAGTAVANARSYTHERHIASRLQAASLPQALPQLEGIVFDAVYTPGSTEAVIGGDWYDAFALGDGRIVVSIGDVMGSGLDAAVQMGKIRQGIRAAAALDADPAAMLTAADFAFRLEQPDGIATAFAAVIDPHSMTMRYASAGHHAPMIRRGDGTVYEPSVEFGLPLGLRAGRTSGTNSLALEAGTLTALYTDGLIEATRDAAAGEALLRSALADPAVANAAHPARALHDAVLPDGARDDVALLTIRVTG